jgi:hypothetical protein
MTQKKTHEMAEEQLPGIIILEPPIAVMVFDRLSSAFNDFLRLNPDVYNDLRKQIGDEYAHVEAERINRCCESAFKRQAGKFKIKFRYFDGVIQNDALGDP